MEQLYVGPLEVFIKEVATKSMRCYSLAAQQGAGFHGDLFIVDRLGLKSCIQYREILQSYGARHNIPLNMMLFRNKSDAEKALDWVNSITVMNKLMA